jgi:hypothetical protein
MEVFINKEGREPHLVEVVHLDLEKLWVVLHHVLDNSQLLVE